MANVNTTEYRRGEYESTEWEDIQRRHGNQHMVGHAKKKPKKQYWVPLPSKEKVIGRKLGAMAKETMEALEDAEDDFDDEGDDDDAVLEAYRRARLSQLKGAASAARFGGVRALQRSEYVREVTEASKSRWVVVHMYQNSVEDCSLLANALDAIAPKFPTVKFLKIVASECVEGYPDAQCPTLMVYHAGECQKQFVTLRELGAKRMTPDDVEWHLGALGALATELECDPAESRPSIKMARDGKYGSGSGMMTRTIGAPGGDGEW